MLPVIYKMQDTSPGGDWSGPHDLALLFIIMAIGAVLGKDPSNARGEHFHQLSRAAISLQPVLEKPSIVAVQTLQLMSIYHGMSNCDLKSETSMETTWSLLKLASQLSKTVYLYLLSFFFSILKNTSLDRTPYDIILSRQFPPSDVLCRSGQRSLGSFPKDDPVSSHLILGPFHH
jgi:hypothetical protein